MEPMRKRKVNGESTASFRKMEQGEGAGEGCSRDGQDGDTERPVALQKNNNNRTPSLQATLRKEKGQPHSSPLIVGRPAIRSMKEDHPMCVQGS